MLWLFIFFFLLFAQLLDPLFLAFHAGPGPGEALVGLTPAGKRIERKRQPKNVQQQVQLLIDEYKAIGHVPFKEKDAIYKQYHDVLDKIYKNLHISNAKRHLDNFKNNLKNVAEKGSDALDNERGRLLRRFDQLRSEITTYENNLGFLNAASKKGNSLVEEMNRKVQKLKDDLELVKQKIKAIDAENK